jgi:hypothetical protein
MEAFYYIIIQQFYKQFTLTTHSYIYTIIPYFQTFIEQTLTTMYTCIILVMSPPHLLNNHQVTPLYHVHNVQASWPLFHQSHFAVYISIIFRFLWSAWLVLGITIISGMLTRFQKTANVVIFFCELHFPFSD